jgi:hypothetical protein
VRTLLLQLLAFAVFAGALLAGALWLTRDPDAAIALGFLGVWTLIGIGAAAQWFVRLLLIPPLDEPTVGATVTRQLLCAGFTAPVWAGTWLVGFPLVRSDLGFFTVGFASIGVAALSAALVYGPRFLADRRSVAQSPSRRDGP